MAAKKMAGPGGVIAPHRPMKKSTRAKIGKANTEEQMLRSVGRYLKSKGWNALVISASRVEEVLAGRARGQYEFVLRFTGGRLPGAGAARATLERF